MKKFLGSVWLFGFASMLALTTMSGQAISQTKPEASPAASAKAAPTAGAGFKGVKGTGPDLLVTFETSMGAIRCQLFHKRAPMTVKNFVGLASGTKEFRDPNTAMMAKRPFYDGLIFHRVIPNFMLQAGCPLKNGTGGPGYTIRDEFHPELKHDRPALLSMANRGPNTGASQFFITEKATPWLDRKHAIFGQCRNLELIKKIARVPVVPPNRPRKDVVMKTVKVTWGKW